jgi:hypothetical protein
MKNCLVLALLATVIFSSCSMEKRVYSRGFHVELGSIADRGRHKTEIKKKAGLGIDKKYDLAIQTSEKNYTNIDITKCNIQFIGEVERTQNEKRNGFSDTLCEKDHPLTLLRDTSKVKASTEKKNLDRKIKITNGVLLGDLISMPLVATFSDGEDLGGIIYLVLIAFPLLIFLLIARISQGIKRRKLKKAESSK